MLETDIFTPAYAHIHPVPNHQCFLSSSRLILRGRSASVQVEFGVHKPCISCRLTVPSNAQLPILSRFVNPCAGVLHRGAERPSLTRSREPSMAASRARPCRPFSSPTAQWHGCVHKPCPILYAFVLTPFSRVWGFENHLHRPGGTGELASQGVSNHCDHF